MKLLLIALLMVSGGALATEVENMTTSEGIMWGRAMFSDLKTDKDRRSYALYHFHGRYLKATVAINDFCAAQGVALPDYIKEFKSKNEPTYQVMAAEISVENRKGARDAVMPLMTKVTNTEMGAMADKYNISEKVLCGAVNKAAADMSENYKMMFPEYYKLIHKDS